MVKPNSWAQVKENNKYKCKYQLNYKRLIKLEI